MPKPTSENRKHNWSVFLEYAKTHPADIPKSASERAEIYHKLMGECRCGGTHKLCPILHLDRVHLKTSTNIKEDPVVLKAEVKALKSEVKKLRAQVKTCESHK